MEKLVLLDLELAGADLAGQLRSDTTRLQTDGGVCDIILLLLEVAADDEQLSQSETASSVP